MASSSGKGSKGWVNKLSANFDKVISILRYMNLRPDDRSYDSNFVIQKTTFLAQQMGIPLPYCFTLYIHGPYSPSLTRDYYNHTDRLSAQESDYELNTNEIGILNRILKNSDLYENQSLMEATATIVFLKNTQRTLNDCEIFAKVKDKKPYLSDETITIGITKAKDLLFKQEYLTEDLKREINCWSSITDGFTRR